MTSTLKNALTPAIIVLRVHNNEQSLSSTLSSIESQSYPNTRLVLVVEPCIDGSTSIARKFADSSSVPTVLISNKDYLGQAKSFNRGLLWIVQESKRAFEGETTLLWNGLDPKMSQNACVALMDGSAIMDKRRLLSPMIEFSARPEVHFIYSDPAEATASERNAKQCHVCGWSFRLWWLMNLKTAAIFDVNHDFLDGWATFVQMLGAGPAIRLEKPLFSYHPV